MILAELQNMRLDRAILLFNRYAPIKFILIILLLISSFGCSPKKSLAIADKQAPSFTFELLNGHSRKSSDYRGKIVLLHFWASWCPTCLHELDTLQNLYRFIISKEQDFEILAIAIDDKRESLLKLQAKKHFSFPLILDSSGNIKEHYRIASLPQSMLIGRNGEFLQFPSPADGEQVTRTTGQQKWDLPSVAQSIFKILNKK